MADPLSYDSFYDPHLQNYFQSRTVRRHLRKAGLINRFDEIIPDKEYRAANQERLRQEQIRALLSHGVVHRVIELEKSRQANIRNQLEATVKRRIVENVKESKRQRRHALCKDLPWPKRPKTSLIGQGHRSHQQQAALAENSKSTSSRISVVNPSRLSARTNTSTNNKTTKLLKPNGDTKDRCRLTMVYLGPQTHHDASPSTLKLKSDEIVVVQQHCSGENLVLFRNHLRLNEQFTFESRRRTEYPFALTLYVNGLIDCRISVCCEYKHKLGVRLGGRRASFAIVDVRGGEACRMCADGRTSQWPKQKRSSKDLILVNDSKKPMLDEPNSKQLRCTPPPFDQPDHSTSISHENALSSYLSAELRRIFVCLSHGLFLTDIYVAKRELRSERTKINIGPETELDFAKIVSIEFSSKTKRGFDECNEVEQVYESLLQKLGFVIDWEETSRLQWQLGNVCKEGLGDYEGALDHYLRSLKVLCKHISPLDGVLRNLCLSIGHVLLLQGNSKKHSAIDYFQRVLDIDCAANETDVTNLVNDHNYLGLLHQNQENFSKALFHFRKCLKHFLSAQTKSTAADVRQHENAYLIDETIYDHKALDSLSINSLPSLSEIHFNLATTYQHIGQKSNALKHAKKALQTATSDHAQCSIYENYLQKLQKI